MIIQAQSQTHAYIYIYIYIYACHSESNASYLIPNKLHILFLVIIKSCWLHGVYLTLSLSLSLFLSFSLSPSVPVVYHSWQILWTASCVGTDLIKSSLIIQHAALSCVEVHKRMSFMRSYLLLQQCPTCLIGLTWIVCDLTAKWLHRYYFVGCYFQDLFKTARSSHLAFSPCVLLTHKRCIHTVVLIQQQLGRNSVLFYQRNQIY